MLVVKEQKKLVLNLRDPNRVTTLIPTARIFQFKGRTLVSVPHELDEVRVLRNIGMDPPSPILSYYEWPGIQQPFDHQRAMAAFMASYQRCYNLSEQGTGKSRGTLYAYDYLRAMGKVRKVLINAPLSSLDRTWGDEVFSVFPHLTFGVLHGSQAQRLLALKQDYDVYIINHHGLGNDELRAEIKRRDDIDLIVHDELATLRNANTDLWKNANDISAKKPWVWGLTGTPTPNLPTDAWAQCRLITPERVPRYFGQFRDRVMKKVSRFKWVPLEHANDVVNEVMQPSIRFTRAECLDLPPTLYQTYEAELGSEQKRLYNDMMKRLKAEYEGGQLVASNEAVKLNKLLQIVTGGAFQRDGTEVTIPAPGRMKVLKEIIEQSSAKVIVFVPFIPSLHAVAEELRKEYSVALIYGEVSKSQRDEIFGAFQRQREPRVLVAQPGTMSHSLTLTAADTIVWYGPTTSNDIYGQANARIPRPGQKLTTLIAHIEASEVERRLYNNLRNKSERQHVLLEMFREQR